MRLMYVICMLSDWLQNVLDETKMSQTELSRQLTEAIGKNIDKAAVNKMVKGARNMSAEEFLAIQRITGITYVDPKLYATFGEQVIREGLRMFIEQKAAKRVDTTDEAIEGFINLCKYLQGGATIGGNNEGRSDRIDRQDVSEKEEG